MAAAAAATAELRLADRAERRRPRTTRCSSAAIWSSSFDPLSGNKIWEIQGSTTECVTSTVTDGGLIFTSGGYPRNQSRPPSADGSGKIAWENNSPRLRSIDARARRLSLCRAGRRRGHVLEGRHRQAELWKSRLAGTFSSSPVLVGDHIFATNEAGQTFVFRAAPDGFQSVAENQLGNEVFATPAICGNRIYLRAPSTRTDAARKCSIASAARAYKAIIN